MNRIIRKIVTAYHFIPVFRAVIIPCVFYKLKGYVTLTSFWTGLGDCCYAFSQINNLSYSHRVRWIGLRKTLALTYFYPNITKRKVINIKMFGLIKKYCYLLEKYFSNYLFIINLRGNPSIPEIEKVRLLYSKWCINTKTLTYPTRIYIQHNIQRTNQKAVLVNFVSNSFRSSLVDDFLVRLSQTLSKNGFVVYYNNDGPDIIKNDVSFLMTHYSLEEIYNKASLFNAIISIRSGFLDFLINTKTTIICLYDKNEVGLHLHKNYSLMDWEAKNSVVHELFVEESSINDVCSLIK